MFKTYANQPSALRSKSWAFTLAVLLVLALISGGAFPSNPIPAAPPIDVAKMALSFIPNQGQTAEAVRFLVHDLGGTVFFTPQETVLSLPGVDQPVRLGFEKANPGVTVSGVERQAGTVNYLIGSDPQAWQTSLPTFAGIVYQGLYRGIDLRFDGAQGTLKGTYTVAPHADPAQIRWRHGGVRDVTLDSSGSLVVALPGKAEAALIEQAPVAWQEVSGKRVSVPVSYTKHANGSWGFALGAYDFSLPLVIDPAIEYGTYLGGAKMDDPGGIAVDGSGSAYLTGTTSSTAFPTHSPYQGSKASGDDVFVAKLNAAGTALVYATYLGGNGDDWGNGIAVDGAGNAYLVGETDSTNFPVHNAYQGDCQAAGGWLGDECLGDAFLAKLSADGQSLLYGTYLGGGHADGANGIAVDGSGNAYLTGETSSTDFPHPNGYQTSLKGVTGFFVDAFVAKINTAASGSASLVYGTYLGGDFMDAGDAVAVDGSGHAYVTGETLSTNFPTKNAYQGSHEGLVDAWVAKLSPSGGDLVYSTYLGGGNKDYGYGIAVDGSGNAYVTGSTLSTDFPTLNPLQGSNAGGGLDGDAFVTKLDGGGGLSYSTYLGGEKEDKGSSIAVDVGGSAILTGATNGLIPKFIAPLLGFQGAEEAFVAKLNAAGSAIVYSTYLGGSEADHGVGIALDGAGNAYVTGMTSSSDFPTTAGVYQGSFSGGSCGFGDVSFTCPDVFVVKINGSGEVALPTGLAGSYKSASTYLLGKDQEVTYTIHLYNSGDSGLTADVTDPLPSELSYVSGGGSYDAGTRTVSWSGVNVPAKSTVELKFTAKPAAEVEKATAVVNKATISAGGETVERQVTIYLAPKHLPVPKVFGSFKTASRVTLGPDQELTYTIHLHNSGTETASVDVNDPVPAELAVVGNPSDGGSYDAGSHTVSWNDISIPAGASTDLTFDVEPAKTVDHPTAVINTATISTDKETFERKFGIVLVPEPLHPGDHIPPKVIKLLIGDGDVLNSREVTLHITAEDNQSVDKMYIREWQLVTASGPARWEEVQSSGWVPYQADYAWTLGAQNGTHYIGVWVADAAENKSYLTGVGLDYASLVQPGATVADHHVVPYLVHYEKGQDVSATLTPTSGDADLYVWFPGNFSGPDAKSARSGSEPESVAFKAPTTGTYLFLVYGDGSATYDLSITPAGGPESWSVAAAATGLVTGQAQAVKPEAFTAEPVLSVAGMDPLGTVAPAAPAGPTVRTFLPFISRR